MPSTARTYEVGEVLDVDDVKKCLDGSEATVFCAPRMVDYYDQFGDPRTSLQAPFLAINVPAGTSSTVYRLPGNHRDPRSFLTSLAYEIVRKQRETLRARETAEGGDTDVDPVGPGTLLDWVQVTPDALAWLVSENLSHTSSRSSLEPSSLQNGPARQDCQAATSDASREASLTDHNVTYKDTETLNQCQEARAIFLANKHKVSIITNYREYFLNPKLKEICCTMHRIIQNGPDPETLADFDRLSQIARENQSLEYQSQVLREGLKSLDSKAKESELGRILTVKPDVFDMLRQDPAVKPCIYDD
jgi:hypothetical protein